MPPSENRNDAPGASSEPEAEAAARAAAESAGTGSSSSGGAANLRTVAVRAPSGTEQNEFGETNSVDSPVPRAEDLYLGKVVDERYVVEEIIGEGGMGIVYLCRHKIIGKRVAMKVLRADLARDAEVTRRFLNEARAASAIGNAHIIDISDFGQMPDGSTYFVMEYLEGMPLSRLIEQSQPIPIGRILHIAKQLAEGLAAAHDAGIVHRDLKPDNIFLVTRGGEKEFVKVLDFGIAKVSTAEGRITRLGTVFGTPHYMSPEQAAGSVVDHRGDIYSFGVILYEMASGRVPFDADNFMGILTQHMYKPPVPIRAISPATQEIPEGFEAIILKCLGKRPEYRYATMHELASELEKVQRGATPQAVPEMLDRTSGFGAPPEYFGAARTLGELPRVSRPRVKVYATLLICVAGIVALVLWGLPESAAPPQRAQPQPSASAAVAASPLPSIPVVNPPIQRVKVQVSPPEAHGFIDTRDLGATAFDVEVPPGGVTTVDLRCPGYVTQSVQLDGTEPHVSVALVASRPATKSVNKPKPAKKSAKPQVGNEIGDPWAR